MNRKLIRPAIAAALVGAAFGAARVAESQESPRYASMSTSRFLLLPAQEVSGAGDNRAWLTRFDSVLTARLESGGIGDGWAYPRDADRYARQNPTYVSNPHLLGTQALKSEKIKAGALLGEPFASRLRALIAIANTRNAIVPVYARLDSSAIGRTAKLQVVFADGRLSSVLATFAVQTNFAGPAMAAADSLAFAVARLFVNP